MQKTIDKRAKYTYYFYIRKFLKTFGDISPDTEDTIMVFEKMKNILAEQLDADADSITMETDIQEDLGADSLDVVEMLMSIEDEFEIEIPDEKIESLKTVGQVVEYIQENM